MSPGITHQQQKQRQQESIPETATQSQLTSLCCIHTHRHKQTFRQYELNISNGRRENAFSVDDEENDDDDVDVGIITTVKVVELSGRKKKKKRQ